MQVDTLPVSLMQADGRLAAIVSAILIPIPQLSIFYSSEDDVSVSKANLEVSWNFAMQAPGHILFQCCQAEIFGLDTNGQEKIEIEIRKQRVTIGRNLMTCASVEDGFQILMSLGTAKSLAISLLRALALNSIESHYGADAISDSFKILSAKRQPSLN